MLLTKKTMPIFKGVNLKEKINALLSDCCFNVEQNTTPPYIAGGKAILLKLAHRCAKLGKNFEIYSFP
jgi:hypothetical protein